jgi:serine/threonine protein kinase
MGWMNVKVGLQRLVNKHGVDLATCAKIVTSVLVPGGGVLSTIVEHLCDHVAHQGERNDQALQQYIEQLGEDQNHVLALITQMESKLEYTLSQMKQAHQQGVDEVGLQNIIETALAQQPALMEVRKEFLQLQPKIKIIQQQNQKMLENQAFAGEMLSQVKDQVNTALSFCQPMISEGLMGQDAVRFMAAHQRFQGSLLAQDWPRVHACLQEMKQLAPHGATVQVCEMAVKAIHKDFTGAEQNLKQAISKAPFDLSLQTAKRGLTALTRGGASSSLSALNSLNSLNSFASTQSLAQSLAQSSAQSLAQSFIQDQSIGDKGWKLQALLGRGGMGEVWKSINIRQTQGALKLMLPSLSNDFTFTQRFRGEIDALMKVKHSNIIEILDWGRDHRSGSWYFVTRYIQGQSLTSRLKAGVLSEDEARYIFSAIAQGLKVCHEAGIVHRDIKPDNIMMTQHGEPILIDFGIALQNKSAGTTQMATLSYAPPEQLAGKNVGPPADLYALGRTLLEASGGWDHLPTSLNQIVDRLTHDNPRHRGNTQQLIQDLLGENPRYYITLNGGDPEGPLPLSEVAHKIAHEDGLHYIWLEGMEGWRSWENIDEIVSKVTEIKSNLRKNTPPPIPSLSALSALSAFGPTSHSTANLSLSPSISSTKRTIPTSSSSTHITPLSTPSTSKSSISSQLTSQSSSPALRSSKENKSGLIWTQGKTQFNVKPPRTTSIAAQVAHQSGLDPHACAVGVRCLIDVLINDFKKSQCAHIHRFFRIKFNKRHHRITLVCAPTLKSMVRNGTNTLIPLTQATIQPHALHRWARVASQKIGQDYAGKYVKGLSTRRRLAWCVHIESQMPLQWAVQLVHAWEWILTERLVNRTSIPLTGLVKLSVSTEGVINKRISPKLIDWFGKYA